MWLMVWLLAAFVPKHAVVVTLPDADSGPTCATFAPWPIHSPLWSLDVFQGPDSVSAMAATTPRWTWGLYGLAPGSTFAFPVTDTTVSPWWYAVAAHKRADSLGTSGPVGCPFNAMRVR